MELAGILASGTNMGNIALWKFMSPARGHKAEGAEQWILMAPATVEGPVRQIEVKMLLYTGT